MPKDRGLSSRRPDVLCLSHLRWDFVFQRPQHLMVRWAKEHRAFFVEEPLAEAAGSGLRRSTLGVHVYAPHVPPDTPPEQTVRLQRAGLDALLAEHEIEDYVLWCYSPMALTYSRHLTPSVTVYDCMDELSGFKGAPPEIGTLERELLSRAHVVFTGGASLYRAKRASHSNVHAFPSSVDVPHFSAARSCDFEPADQAAIARPRLGFFGVIDERMDLALLAELAKRRPDWQLVLVGPVVKIDPDSLPRLPNIHYLGQKTYAELPSYLAGWDVALLPFARNESTRFISPTKTPEYLAGGKPVVSTPIADVVSPYGELGLAQIADDAESFEHAIELCLKEDRRRLLARADEYLAHLSWDKTFEAMQSLVRCAAGEDTWAPAASVGKGC